MAQEVCATDQLSVAGPRHLAVRKEADGEDRIVTSATAAEPIANTRLGWQTRLAWMACAMPELIKSFAWDSFVLFYYSQVVGLNGFLIGIAIAVILVTDAIVDPYVGALSDRMGRGFLGRRHTLMALAILPFAVGITMIFRPPAELEQWQIFAWLLGFGVLARISISFWTVPAYAMGGELSRHTGERNIIAVLRNLGNQLAILTVPAIAFGVFFIPSEAFQRPQLNPEPYPAFGLFVAGLTVILMLVGLLGTRSRMKQIESSDEQLQPDSPFETLPALIKRLIDAIRITPNVGRLLLVALLVLFTTSVVNQLSLHLATYFWKLDAGSTQNLLMAGVYGTVAAMVFAPMYLKLVGTRFAMISGLIAYFLVQSAAILLPLLGFAPPPASAAIGTFVFACRVLGGFAYGLYVVPFNTLTYDIGDEHEANTGTPQQGLVSSFMFIGLQVGSGLVALMAGSFLGIIDFPAGMPADAIPEDKVRALAWFVFGLIIAGGLITAWMVKGFDASKEKQSRIRKTLDELRSQSSTAKSPPAP